MNDSASLPIAVSACCIAASEPSASPSGCSCVHSTKRSAPCSSAMTSWKPCSPIRGSLLSEDALEPVGALRRVVVDERQLRRVLEPELGGDPSLQEPARGLERRHRQLARTLLAEHRHEDPRVAEVR